MNQWTTMAAVGMWTMCTLSGAEFSGLTEKVNEGTLRITQIDNTGTIGDLYIIQTPDDKVTLVDTGFGSMPEVEGFENFYQTNFADNMLKRDISHIDTLIISHPHTDHFAALPELFEDKRFTIKKILQSTVPNDKLDEDQSKVICDLIRKKAPELKMELIECKNGQIFQLGNDVTIEILSTARPDVEVENYINNNSVVFLLRYNDFTMLFTGDMGFEQEAELVGRVKNLKADVLKAGHHAGAGNTNEEFLDAVQPQIVVAPMPQWLSNDPRGKRVYELLKERKVPFYRSWEYPGLVIWSDGKTFQLTK